ncbi:MAG: putative enoyl-CoA hydratase echA6 [Acidimicrobiales bacterium]|nr:MAG: putative enoyl-CoA hydratase echA6 [Acidimicrobiales bacterium]
MQERPAGDRALEVLRLASAIMSGDGSQETVRLHPGDRHVVVELCRPERRNAIDRDSAEMLAESLEEAGGSFRVLVLAGAGEHFCAGADLDTVEDPDFPALLRRSLEALRRPDWVTIAAVHGAALGAGTQLAAACDLRVATPGSRFGIPASRLGLMVDAWTVRRLYQTAGGSVAAGLLLGGWELTAEQAKGCGFVHELGDRSVAVGWAERIAAMAPLSLEGHKIGLLAEEGSATREEYEEAFVRAWGSEDLREGLSAFRERRPAEFTGR